MPGLMIGDTLPDLEVETTQGKIRLHDYANCSFTILFSYPGDFTLVCTTMLGTMAAYADKFTNRGMKLLGLSADDIASHKEWIKDVKAYNNGHKVTYQIGSNPDRRVIKQLNMVDLDEKDFTGQ